MFTIFTTAKPFRGPFDVIQRNALGSWKRLPGGPQILLLGSGPGYEEAARDLAIEHVPDVRSSASGIPLVNAMVETAEARARHSLMLLVAADTLLFEDIVSAARIVADTFERFCIVAGRQHLDLREPIDFGRIDWTEAIRARSTPSTADDIFAGDFFLYSRGIWGEIPPFVEGRTAVDNWLFYRVLERKGALVDATEVVTTIHQDHDYSHHPQGIEGVFKGPDAEYNRKLAGGPAFLLSRDSANWVLGRNGLRRPAGFLRKRLRTWVRAGV
jgi:hypothetical protein